MKKPYQQIAITLPTSLVKELTKEAKKPEYHSRNHLIRLALIRFMESVREINNKNKEKK